MIYLLNFSYQCHFCHTHSRILRYFSLIWNCVLCTCFFWNEVSCCLSVEFVAVPKVFNTFYYRYCKLCCYDLIFCYLYCLYLFLQILYFTCYWLVTKKICASWFIYYFLKKPSFLEIFSMVSDRFLLFNNIRYLFLKSKLKLLFSSFQNI